MSMQQLVDKRVLILSHRISAILKDMYRGKFTIRMPKHCYTASVYTNIIGYVVWLKRRATENSILLSQ
jgi:hypothetical protein